MIMSEHCKRCKRILKNPVSVIHGYGPSCWKKVLHEIKPIDIVDDFSEMVEKVK